MIDSHFKQNLGSGFRIGTIVPTSSWSLTRREAGAPRNFAKQIWSLQRNRVTISDGMRRPVSGGMR
jgi:hypothetical protein